MRDMQGRIGVSQWGAFDVENYGDQLFPLIARDQLTARLLALELVCHAPVGVGDMPPASPPLFPLVEGGGPLEGSRREYFARHVDAVLIGGGDLGGCAPFWAPEASARPARRSPLRSC